MGRGGDRRGYHHGNLRAALVEAGVALVAEKGVAGFTLAEAARAAGVSPAAPYRHFRDREALLAEIARQGFERFADRLEAAWNGGEPSPLAALGALGEAYLAFARQERALFTAMFGLDGPRDGALAAAADRAFGVLHSAASALTRHLPEDRRPPAHMMSYHIWAMSHGVAELFAGEGAQPSPIPAEELLESGVGIYLRGLGLVPPD
jgi:AcrR family transcriptional regulator